MHYRLNIAIIKEIRGIKIALILIKNQRYHLLASQVERRNIGVGDGI